MSHLGRQLTVEEARDAFLRHIHGLIAYWGSHDEAVLAQPKSERERLEGLAFSILVAIDGESCAVPAMSLLPRVPAEDQEYLKDKGETWWPDGADLADAGLHDSFHRVGKELAEAARQHKNALVAKFPVFPGCGIPGVGDCSEKCDGHEPDGRAYRFLWGAHQWRVVSRCEKCGAVLLP